MTGLKWEIVLSASVESLKIVIGVWWVSKVLFPAVSWPTKIAHSSASMTYLFLPRKTLLFSHLLRFLSFQQAATPAFPWLSFDPSTQMTCPARYFFASSNAFFLASMTMSLLKLISKLGLGTGYTPSAGSMEWLLATCWANKWPKSLGFVFSAHIRVSSGCSPGCEFSSPSLRLIGRMWFVGWQSGRVSSR